MDVAKDILEIIYFLSGPALVIVAFMALAQIKVAKSHVEEQKRAATIGAKRDSLKVAAEQIKDYSTNIIPMINELDKKISKGGVKFFDNSETFISDDGIRVKPSTDTEDIKSVMPILEVFTKTMNAVEGFATFFVSGVADEKIAYRSLSTTFCDTLKKNMPLIVMLSSDANSYSATLTLFSIWSNRLDAEDLEKQRVELEDKLKNKQEKTIKIVGETA